MQTVDSAQAGNGRIVALASGDVVALLVFAAIGRSSHGEPIGPAAFGEVLYTATPFLVAWLISAPLLGGFSLQTTNTPLKMLRATAVSWCAALVLGAVVRAIMIGRFSHYTFYVMTFLVAMLILCVWRGTFALWEQRGDRVA
ncbi:MAG: DUF3054 domain-containing protein [Oscillochloris sp.]|nr:DUF3054 domain-containing protein [Oscillochloris sp.]